MISSVEDYGSGLYPSRRYLANGIVRMLEFARLHQISPKTLLHGSGIDLACLQDPEYSITAGQEFRVVQNLQQALPLPELGFEVGDFFRLSTLGLLGASMMHCATLGEALAFLLRHIDLTYSFFRIELLNDAQSPRVVLSDAYPLGDLRQFYLQRDVMFGIRAIRDAVPDHWREVLREVRWGGDPETPRLLSSLGLRLNAGCCAAELVLDRPALMLPLPLANALTLQLLEKQCNETRARLKEVTSVRGQVSKVLVQSGFSHGVGEVAASLCLTERTLRRRLAAEGTGFQHLLAETRCEQAKLLLANTPLSVAAIAERLAYSESAVFINAFRRWTGHTPQTFRRFYKGQILPEQEP